VLYLRKENMQQMKNLLNFFYFKESCDAINEILEKIGDRYSAVGKLLRIIHSKIGDGASPISLNSFESDEEDNVRALGDVST
jgi:hypothetical protein